MSDLSHDGQTASELKTQAPSGLLELSAWAHLPWLRAAFSTRAPGESQCYGLGEQNLGWTSEDEPAVVAANRDAFLAKAMRGAKAQLVTLGQVHGSTIQTVVDASSMSTESRGKLEGDGLLTTQTGLALAILTADCVPILLADTRTRAVAAVHAGWRGTLGGIVGKALQLFEGQGSRPSDLVAAIGPAIRPCCFQVGAEVRTAFLAAFPNTVELFSASKQGAENKFQMDLQEANRRQLIAGTLAPEQIQVVAECTACSRRTDGSRKYFSYRAESGVTGRMMSLIATVSA